MRVDNPKKAAPSRAPINSERSVVFISSDQKALEAQPRRNANDQPGLVLALRLTEQERPKQQQKGGIVILLLLKEAAGPKTEQSGQHGDDQVAQESHDAF